MPALLDSLLAGGGGYCGIAASFYPSLLAWLCENFKNEPEKADELQRLFSISDRLALHMFPASAKLFLGMCGLSVTAACRVRGHAFKEEEANALAALRRETISRHKRISLPRAASYGPEN